MCVSIWEYAAIPSIAYILAKMEFIHTYILTHLFLFLSSHVSPRLCFLHLSYVYEIAAFCEKRTEMSHSRKISENTHTSATSHSLRFCSHTHTHSEWASKCACVRSCAVYLLPTIYYGKKAIYNQKPPKRKMLFARAQEISTIHGTLGVGTTL